MRWAAHKAQIVRGKRILEPPVPKWSRSTATLYMRWARAHTDFERGASEVSYTSMRDLSGDKARKREQRQAIKAQIVTGSHKTTTPLSIRQLSGATERDREHYRRAGEMLLEAKDQIARGGWGKWLSKNFSLSSDTARLYMRWARSQNVSQDHEPPPTSLNEMRGVTERRREQRDAPQEKAFRKTLRDIAREDFALWANAHNQIGNGLADLPTSMRHRASKTLPLW